jgi:hypothetical protein
MKLVVDRGELRGLSVGMIDDIGFQRSMFLHHGLHLIFQVVSSVWDVSHFHATGLSQIGQDGLLGGQIRPTRECMVPPGIAAWGQMASRPHLGELLVQAGQL